MGKQHRVNGINVEDYKGTFKTEKVNTKKNKKEIDKNTLHQLKNKIFVMSMLQILRKNKLKKKEQNK
jgi:hypothetical protein